MILRSAPPELRAGLSRYRVRRRRRARIRLLAMLAMLASGLLAAAIVVLGRASITG